MAPRFLLLVSATLAFQLCAAVKDEDEDGEVQMTLVDVDDEEGSPGLDDVISGETAPMKLMKVAKTDDYKSAWPSDCSGTKNAGGRTVGDNKKKWPLYEPISTSGFRCNMDDEIPDIFDPNLEGYHSVCCKGKCQRAEDKKSGCERLGRAEYARKTKTRMDEIRATAAAAAAASAAAQQAAEAGDVEDVGEGVHQTEDDANLQTDINEEIAKIIASAPSGGKFVEVKRVPAGPDAQEGVKFDVEVQILNDAVHFEAGSVEINPQGLKVLEKIQPIIMATVQAQMQALGSNAVFCVHGATLLDLTMSSAETLGGGRARTVQAWLAEATDGEVPMGVFDGPNYHPRCEPILDTSNKFTGALLASIMYKVYDSSAPKPKCRSSDFYKFYNAPKYFSTSCM